MNRQRKRAATIIRCKRNVKVLNYIKAETTKLNDIEEELRDYSSPKFIEYIDEQLHILEGFSKDDVLKIELEELKQAMETAQISLETYLVRLDNLAEKLHVKN